MPPSDMKISSLKGERLNPPIGSKAMVELQGMGGRFPTEFVGWDVGKYVLVKPPVKHDFMEHLFNDKPVVVRYINDSGQICGFRTAVQGMIHSPMRLLVLHYPARLEILNLRKSIRVVCFLPCVVILEDDSEYNGYILNLSKGGCGISLHSEEKRLTAAMAPKTRLLVRFRLTGEANSDFYFSAVIKKAGLEQPYHFIGVEFENVPTDILVQIEEFVRTAADHIHKFPTDLASPPK